MPLTETILWADGFILVYSITDRNSFNYVKLVKQYIVDTRLGSSSASSHSGASSGASSPSSGSVAAAAAAATAAAAAAASTSLSVNVPIVLLGNKGDMVHLRQVAAEEGALTKS